MPPVLPLPIYSHETLAALSAPDLIALIVRDQNRVTREVIDACVARADEFLPIFETMVNDDRLWQDEVIPDTAFWLVFHPLMILGFIAHDAAGQLLLQFQRKLAHLDDFERDEWCARYWPSWYANKSPAIVAELRELAVDLSVKNYLGDTAMEAVLALAYRTGPTALENTLDWIATVIQTDTAASDELRQVWAGYLRDFPRPRHRAVIESLLPLVPEDEAEYVADDIDDAFARGEDQPYVTDWSDPSEFYTAEALANRQQMHEAMNEDDTLFDSEDLDTPYNSIAEPYRRDKPKIGRNDPCHCGSGKKYKKCHWSIDEM